MRIGLVIDNLDPRRGGAEQWTFQHAEHLLARGHEVHIVAQEISCPTRPSGIVPHCLGPVRSILGRAEAAERELRSLGLDMIHDIGTGWYSHVFQSEDGSRIAQWERKLQATPRWLRSCKRAMIRMLPRYRNFRRLMARQFDDPSRIVVAISKMCARHYQQYHGVPPERIRLVYHGVDQERFSPQHTRRWREPIRKSLGIRDEEVVFLFVGHSYRRKGLFTAIRAVNRLVAEGTPVRLLIVGGKRHDHLPRLSGLQRAAVTLVGAVEDPLPYYAAADALVLPSFYDPFGLVVLEAAACCLPAVTTSMTGAGELMSEGVEGYVLSDPSDDGALADRLRLLMDPTLRRRMGEAGRKLALQHSLDRSCDETVAIYHEIAGQRRCAA